MWETLSMLYVSLSSYNDCILYSLSWSNIGNLNTCIWYLRWSSLLKAVVHILLLDHISVTFCLLNLYYLNKANIFTITNTTFKDLFLWSYFLFLNCPNTCGKNKIILSNALTSFLTIFHKAFQKFTLFTGFQPCTLYMQHFTITACSEMVDISCICLFFSVCLGNQSCP